MELTFTIDGQSSNEAFPSKDSGYISESVTCDDGVTAGWNNESWSLTNINSNNNNKIKCNVNFIRIVVLSSTAKIGDYVEMIPTSTSYTISASDTGYTSDQIINPSELNMWRIIKINEDGTIEMVSDNVSSTSLYFSGKKAFLNCVGILNKIAKQYENSNYTVGSRYIGYNGQTEYITDDSKITYPPPWKGDTSSNNNENSGGGDINYQNDIDLVQNALKTLKASKVNEKNVSKDYWIASRLYSYINSNYYIWRGRYINANGELYYTWLYYYDHGWGKSNNNAYHIRPIIKLKSDLRATGEGTENNHWKLS